MRDVKRIHSIDGSQWFRLPPFGLLCLFAISCSPNSPQPPDGKELIPITGEIRLNGQPAHGVVVMFVQKSTMARKDPNYMKGLVDEAGRLAVGTYTNDDGVPPDDYVLTFLKYDTSRIVIGQKPADLLQGKYSNPTTSEHTVTVPSGELSFDIGTIELTSPEAAAK
jgi:hypothetical protein